MMLDYLDSTKAFHERSDQVVAPLSPAYPTRRSSQPTMTAAVATSASP